MITKVEIEVEMLFRGMIGDQWFIDQWFEWCVVFFWLVFNYYATTRPRKSILIVQTLNTMLCAGGLLLLLVRQPIRLAIGHLHTWVTVEEKRRDLIREERRVRKRRQRDNHSTTDCGPIFTALPLQLRR